MSEQKPKQTATNGATPRKAGKIIIEATEADVQRYMSKFVLATYGIRPGELVAFNRKAGKLVLEWDIAPALALDPLEDDRQ